jgi:ATP-dependent DNA helicase DinG
LIDRQGGSSFNEYSVPSAIISLKQGIGRLIRSTTDRGVIALLDPRITTKNYGRAFPRKPSALPGHTQYFGR